MGRNLIIIIFSSSSSSSSRTDRWAHFQQNAGLRLLLLLLLLEKNKIQCKDFM